MKYIILIVLSISSVFFTSDWLWFTSEEGRFTVWVPAEMTEKVTPVETPVGRLEYHVFYCTGTEEEVEPPVFMVSYCDYPEGSIHADSSVLLQDFFEGTIEAAAESVKGELVYDSFSSFGKYPGRLWRISTDTKTIKTWAFMVQNRYYAVQTVGPRDNALHPDHAKFMDSFKLSKKKEGGDQPSGFFEN